ncbi:MAG: hypothetical protein P4L53_24745 [Candidatus Obscuribacterales bacterium]|nr:hypothetical protein [Candidatus Obscuribacterales bacterium]
MRIQKRSQVQTQVPIEGSFLLALLFGVCVGAAFAQTAPLKAGIEQYQMQNLPPPLPPPLQPMPAPVQMQPNMLPANINQNQFQGGMQQGQNGYGQQGQPLQQSVQQSNFNMQYGQGFQPNMQQGFAQQQPPPMFQGNAQAAPPMIQMGGVQGGEEAFGCLGCVISPHGVVIKIYPESDLNRFQIAPDDRVVGINGHPFDGRTFPSECLGLPGSIIGLTILHFGMPMDVQVHRVDSRELAGHASYYKHWAQKTRQW